MGFVPHCFSIYFAEQSEGYRTSVFKISTALSLHAVIPSDNSESNGN